MKRSDSIIIAAITAASLTVGATATYFLLKNKEKIAKKQKKAALCNTVHSFFENMLCSVKKRRAGEDESSEFVEEETENVAVSYAAEEVEDVAAPSAAEEVEAEPEAAPEALEEISQPAVEEAVAEQPKKSGGRKRKKKTEEAVAEPSEEVSAAE